MQVLDRHHSWVSTMAQFAWSTNSVEESALSCLSQYAGAWNSPTRSIVGCSHSGNMRMRACVRVGVSDNSSISPRSWRCLIPSSFQRSAAHVAEKKCSLWVWRDVKQIVFCVYTLRRLFLRQAMHAVARVWWLFCQLQRQIVVTDACTRNASEDGQEICLGW